MGGLFSPNGDFSSMEVVIGSARAERGSEVLVMAMIRVDALERVGI